MGINIQEEDRLLRATSKDEQAKSYCLLLTACIDPNRVNTVKNLVARIDPTIRMDDYKKALLFWDNYHCDAIKCIVFIDNSGADLSEIRQLEKGFRLKVEILQCHASEIPEGLHYGYSESEMIDYAVDHSEGINSCDKIIKVTGRLTFPRLAELIQWIPRGNKLLCDSRDYSFLSRAHRYIVTTLIIVDRAFYRDKLYNTRHLMPNLEFGLLEVLYFHILKPLFRKDSNEIILRFPFNAEPEGFGATRNVNYKSYKTKATVFIRGIMRKVAPQIWI